MTVYRALFTDVQLSIDMDSQHVYSHYKLALNSTEAAMFCDYEDGQLFGEYNLSIYDEL